MKLLRCHIVNYGCLHDFSYKFNNEINLINRPNGWGKSTFVSFLSSMLYGLDSTSKRNIQDNERKHYQPWQGGPFGGFLEFEVSGRQYRAERFFGRREKDDTFTLYDLKTMLPSQDYSSKLGFELFNIDKNGYLKSTCIPQGKLSPEYNDTLAARLTGLTQTTDDIVQYEKAVTTIDRALRFYVKTGNRGEIALLQQEADLTNKRLLESLQAGHEIDQLFSELRILKQQKEQMHEQIYCYQQQIEFATRLETQSHYDLLNRQLEQKDEALEQIENFFHDQLPEESDIELYLQSCLQLSEIQLHLQQNALNNSQIADYLFLQNLFSCCPVSEPDSEDLSKPVLSETADIFSPVQQKLLISSAEYKTEAAVLFSSTEDTSLFESCFSDKMLPDSDTLCQARELYFQYCDFLAEQKEKNSAVSSITQQLEYIKSSLDEEHQIISDCRQKILLLPKQDSPVEIPENNTSNNCLESKFGDEISNNICHLALRFLVRSVLIFIMAGIIGYFSSPAIGFVVGLTGIIFLIYNVFRHQMNSEIPTHSDSMTVTDPPQSAALQNENLQKERIQIETEIQLRTDSCTRFENQLIRAQAQLASAEKAASDASSAANTCLQQLKEISLQMNLPLDEQILSTDEFLAHLARLSSQLEQYAQKQKQQYGQYRKQSDFYKHLKKKYENYVKCSQYQEKLEQTFSDLRNSIAEYLRTYFFISDTETPAGLEAKLHNLKAQLVSYKKMLADRQSSAHDLNTFLLEHPDFQKQSTELFQEKIHPQPRLLSKLQAEQSILREQYTDCIRQISSCQSQIQQKREIAEKYHALEEKKLKLEQQIAAYQERYRILSLTKQYMVKAKQDFSDNYLKSIEKNFNHYAKILQKDLLLNANINSDFHVLVSDEGILREAGWYSQGTRDLMDLCFRLSIVEDLFSEEPPFLILDDPFINLDDRSLEQISTILHDISDRWQILYFTCHSSRNI